MAIEVQRMRERLVNLGIAVAEIAPDGESTDRKWDGDNKFSDYSLPPESPSKRSAFAARAAAEFEESCMPSPPSEPPGSAQYGAKMASSFFLHERVADGTESSCSGVVDKRNCNGLSPGESYNLGAAAPCTMGTPRTPRTPRTPSGTHNLRNLDGRKIDLWQIKAREDPEGRKGQTVEEELPQAAQTPCAKVTEKFTDKQGSGVNHVPSIYRSIKIPSKAELGRVLAHRGERNVAERMLNLQGHSPCSRAAGPPAKSFESELAERKENEIVANHKDTVSSLGTSPTFGRELMSRENILPNSGEGIRSEELRPDGRHPNIEKKTDSHASQPSCTFLLCKDTLPSINSFEESNLEKREMSHQHEAESQGDKQMIRTQRLFARCKSVDMNEFLGTFHALSY